MAEDTEKKVLPAPTGSKKMQLIVIALLMLGEGAVVYFVANAMSPRPIQGFAVEADKGVGEDANPMDELVEIDIVSCKPSNKMSGKLVLFQMRTSALIARSDLEKVTTLLESKGGRISDRVNFVIRSADPKHLNEPGLETIKRRIKHELDGLLGDERLIKEVLIPELLQSNAGN